MYTFWPSINVVSFFYLSLFDICSVSFADVAVLVHQLFLPSFRVESKRTTRNVLRTSQMLHLSLAYMKTCSVNKCCIYIYIVLLLIYAWWEILCLCLFIWCKSTSTNCATLKHDQEPDCRVGHSRTRFYISWQILRTWVLKKFFRRKFFWRPL